MELKTIKIQIAFFRKINCLSVKYIDQSYKYVFISYKFSSQLCFIVIILLTNVTWFFQTQLSCRLHKYNEKLALSNTYILLETFCPDMINASSPLIPPSFSESILKEISTSPNLFSLLVRL